MLPLDLEEQPFLVCGLVTFAIQFCGFAVAYPLQTEKFYDILGSGNFLLLGLWTYFSNTAGGVKCLIGTGLFCASRLWLLVFLAWRAHDRKGDSRFDGVKEHAPTFLLYWMVQGTWVYCVSLSIVYMNTSTKSTEVEKGLPSPQDMIWMSLFAVAILLEIVSDVQKTLWVKRGREGGFCSVGIWKWSRHPNYFAEMLQWWSCYFMACSVSGDYSWFSLLSPLFTMWVLLLAEGTGVPNAEGQGLERYYKKHAKTYREYRAQTSILVPLPNKLYSVLPMPVKRIFLFEWASFEYQGEKSE